MIITFKGLKINFHLEVESAYWWKVYDLETRNIFVSRDVIFHEEIYPFAQIKSVEKGGKSNFRKKENLYVEDDFDDCIRYSESG